MFETLLIIAQALWVIFYKFILPASILTSVFIVFYDWMHPMEESEFGTHDCDHDRHKHARQDIGWY